MGTSYGHLTAAERTTLMVMLAEGSNQSAVATHLRRDRSTISRELARNGSDDRDMRKRYDAVLSSERSPTSTSCWRVRRCPSGPSSLASSISYSCRQSSRPPFAGAVVQCFGTRRALWGALAVAALGLLLILSHALAAVLLGLALIGVGTFLAQSTATGFVSRAAKSDHGAARRLYLALY